MSNTSQTPHGLFRASGDSLQLQRGEKPLHAPENPLELLLSTLPHALAPTTPTSYFAAWLRYCVVEAGVELPPRVLPAG